MRPAATATLALALALTGCRAGVPSPTALLPGGPDPSGAPRESLAWAELSPATFARARAQGRLVVIDGSAEWCHWCHVMEATTYHDAAVRQILDERFVAVKVDVDAHPDFEERYAAWGWPATVLMTAEGEELGTYKGYLPPERFAEILGAVAAAARGRGAGAAREPAGRAATEAEITEASARARRQLDEYWDPRQGGWGVPQKAILAWDDAWTLSRARAGEPQAWPRAALTLERQLGLIDPIWGGVCQYSTDGDWVHPHHEKLMAVQAGAIAAYAEAFAQSRDDRFRSTAQRVRGFVDGFLTGPEGGFFATMDADLNAHDRSARYVRGDDYYARSDAERRALGVPRVDRHEYGRDNGLAIAAYVALYQATGDASALEVARRATHRMLETHGVVPGGFTHDARPADEGKVLYLADNAAMGLALVRLYEATGDAALLTAATGVATLLLTRLEDPGGGGFYASTPDPGAVGVFATRRKPFEHDVMAIRFLARLMRAAPRDAYRSAIARALSVVTRPEAIEERGRMVGDLLLALEETRGLR